MGRQKTEATKQTTLEYCRAVSRTVFLREEKISQKCAIRASIKRVEPQHVKRRTSEWKQQTGVSDLVRGAIHNDLARRAGTR